jgi:hypothetical protein
MCKMYLINNMAPRSLKDVHNDQSMLVWLQQIGKKWTLLDFLQNTPVTVQLGQSYRITELHISPHIAVKPVISMTES